ncbi:hypothetical protein [Longitalea luteola]|uniref:hypothetical protein n=1 Tax=Longitalea luteola TaxID=2812563 RepID=UPI001A97CDA0|nr:hypothetical protein [Longitalea luteola]
MKNCTLITLPYENSAWPGRAIAPLHTANSNPAYAIAYPPFTSNIPDIAAVPFPMACVTP